MALAVEGFVLLACLPVALEWSEVHVPGPPGRAPATGALLLAGTLGGVVPGLLVPALVATPYAAMLVMAATPLPGTAGAHGLPATAPTPALQEPVTATGPVA